MIPDSITPNNSLAGQAFAVLSALDVGARYASTLTSNIPGTINVNFGTGAQPENRADFQASSTSADRSLIRLDPIFAFEWDAILHEYGHFFQSELKFNNPGAGGTHAFEKNISDENNSKPSGLAVAYDEGYVTYFSISAQLRMGTPVFGTVGNRLYDTDGHTRDLETETGLGEDNEVSVFSLLWDLTDADVDGADRINLTEKSLSTSWTCFSPPPAFGLITFKDGVTLRIVTNDLAKLKAEIDGLTESGGGGCPESSIAATVAGIDLVAPGGRVLMATDAASRGDTNAEATPLALNGPARIGNVGRSGDKVDVFAVTAAAGVRYVLPVRTNGTVAVEVVTADGTRVATGSSSDLSPVSFVASAAGTYFVRVTIRTANTNFTTAPTVTLGSGVTVNAARVIGPTELQVDVTIAPGAAVGFRNVAVTGGSASPLTQKLAVFVGQAGLSIPTVSGVSPSSATPGVQTVTVTGSMTRFVNGTTTASFGAGVTVLGVTVTSPTTATVMLRVEAGAGGAPLVILFNPDGTPP